MNDPYVIGGIGEKKSNNNTQWYQQDRIYDGSISISITTCCNPYYLVGANMNNMKNELCNNLIKNNQVQEYDVIKHSYTSQIMNGNKKCVERNNGNMITLTTRGDCVGTVVKDNMNNLRVRKLTPRECFRLMGVKDEDFDKIAKNQSNSSLYHLAGDSIVTNILCAIFKQMI